MSSHVKMFTKDKLVPLMDVWPEVRDALGVGGFDAIVFVEQVFEDLKLRLYLPDGLCGLWKMADADASESMLSDLGVSGAAHAFSDNDGKEYPDDDDWKDCRITTFDFDKIVERANAVATQTPADEGRPANSYPEELRAAIEAFEAVHGDPVATTKRTPKAAISAWLESNKPGLSVNARERIATVANWQPSGGAPKTSGE